MKALAVVLFLGGLLLAVRVMFFGVQRRLDDERLMHRKWPLALAAFFTAFGALLYARASTGGGVTAWWAAVVVLVGLAAGATAWWFVQRSSTIPSTDPEDDPRYRFQGHVARVIEAIASPDEPGKANHGKAVEGAGRIAFDFDGKRYELRACWSPESVVRDKGPVPADSEVVIDRVEGEVAYVEPWTVVEERL